MDKTKEVLIELIVKNFDSTLAETTAKRKNHIRRESKSVSIHHSSISTIISNILANSSLSKAESSEKKVRGLKEGTIDDASEQSETKSENPVHGGYGTIKPYAGMSPHVKYSDYSRIWSHIGSFRAYGSSGSAESQNEIAMRNGESTREMVGMETIEKAAKHFKYFVRGEVMGDIGYVPPTGLGINSQDWEKYRLMTQISFYRPLLKLMHSVI